MKSGAPSGKGAGGRLRQQPGKVWPNLNLRPVAPQILTRPPQLAASSFLVLSVFDPCVLI